MAEKLGMKRRSLQLFLLAAQICYHKNRYLKGLKITTKSVKLAKEMGTKDLYAEALLMQAKHEIKQDNLSKIETLGILDEVIRIAEEIGYPEVLWKVYIEYGAALQSDREYSKALEYFQKCIEIFTEVSSRIKNKSYKKSYLSHPDRQAVFIAVDNIEGLLKKG